MQSVPPTPNPDQIKGVTVEEIVSGTRCSPLTLKEFEGFLIHEEHSVENLQFQVWYRSYRERFAALGPEYQALSEPPAERYTQFSTPAGSIRTAASMKGEDEGWWSRLIRRRSQSSVDQDARSSRSGYQPDPIGLGFGDPTAPHDPTAAEKIKEKAEHRDDPMDPLVEGEAPAKDDDDAISLRSAAGTVTAETPTFAQSTTFPTVNRFPSKAPSFSRVGTTLSENSSVNTENMERKMKKFPNLRFANLAPLVSIRSRKELPEDTPLPFVDEISLILTTFFLPGASKELNIDARLRRHILKSLQPTLPDGTKGPPATTHPDVFKEASEHTYALMERSLPHYLQWAKGNTNTPKMLFWYGVGITDFGIGVMIAMICLYFTHHRWWRLTSWLFIQFGTMQAYSASRYFCSQVHGRTARQLYPWELTSEINEADHAIPSFTIAMGPNGAPAEKKTQNKINADLAASLPFLFDDPPADAGATTTSPETSSLKKPHAIFRSRFWASLRGKKGERIPVFGPERVVEDPYIKEVHNKQIREILIVGLLVTLVMEAVFLAIPERHPM